MNILLAALLLALPLLSSAQNKTVDDPSWWWNTAPETMCHKTEFDAAFQTVIDLDNKRLKQTNIITAKLKAMRCAKDDATAQQWSDRCGGQKKCKEAAVCPGLRKSLPPPPDIFGDAVKFQKTTGAEYDTCVTQFTKAAANARATYIAEHTPPVKPAVDPQWAGKSCAQLKKTRDIIAGLAASCVASPATCLLTASEITGIELTMKKLGCN